MLKNKVNSKEINIEKLINTRLGRKPVLAWNLEEELVIYCLMMELRSFGLTRRSNKRMVFDLAIKNGLAHPLLLQQGRASWKWLRKFMCRHPRLMLLKPQVTSAARVKGLTKINFAKYFAIFESMLGAIIFSSHCLLNYEETGLNIVQHKVCEVISHKGKRRISPSSTERGSLVTIVICMNATVTQIPPLMVFLRATWRLNFWMALHFGSIAACHKAGWIQKDSFKQKFKHFSVLWRI